MSEEDVFDDDNVRCGCDIYPGSIVCFNGNRSRNDYIKCILLQNCGDPKRLRAVASQGTRQRFHMCLPRQRRLLV